MAKRRNPTRRDGVSRRRALIGAAGAGVLAGCAPVAGRVSAPQPGPPVPFRHGVASGDPRQDRVVLWTRVTPLAGEPVEVRWIVAADAELTDVLAEGEARAEAARDWTVKVEAEDLEPGATYFYAFETAGGARSPVGRTRTLPEGPTPGFAIAVVSCANHPAGYFNVYRDIADRSDADLVLCLGDYLYEYGPGEYAADWGAKSGRIPDPPHEIVTLADYRTRHAQYKSDDDLQAAHAVAPWIMIWDDHETANDATEDSAQNHQDDEGAWSERKQAALQAYFEWTPVREPTPGRAREALWRSFEIGDLATLVMLETRLTARSPLLSWNDSRVPATADLDDRRARAGLEAFLRDVVGAEDREMLGRAQEADVEAALARSVAAGKPWQLLGNQVAMAPFISPDYVEVLSLWMRLALRLRDRDAYALLRRSAFELPLNLDQWDGYPAARERLYAAARRSGAQLLTLTGDTHTFMVSKLLAADGRPAGVEIGTSAVSSPSAALRVPDIGVDLGELTLAANPHVLHHNVYDRGYVALTLTPGLARAELRRVDTVESREVRAEAYKTFEIRRNGDGELAIEEAASA